MRKVLKSKAVAVIISIFYSSFASMTRTLLAIRLVSFLSHVTRLRKFSSSFQT